ncbi:TetR/AcrR family transcriptional regulator [Ideonella sp. YS5]|uniref:TetR/AcrR family transcriptional regulator n=1 Tax=Ideonella sp. YS5 TaxID=3453714 RepID=UPI003EECE087
MPQTEDEAATPPRRGRPRDPERLRRIMEAARSHFYAHGLERASVDAIAADAGVSKMTIYSHFTSKEGLFEAVVRDRTDRVVGGLAGVEALDPNQPQKALMTIGEHFLTLAREEDTLGHFRSLYGAAGTQREACEAFYRQGPERLIGDLAAYLRRADAAGSLNVRHPRQAADLFLAMFLGDGHIRGLMMLEPPDARENKALLREAVRVFIAAYSKAP